jgi:DNA-binding phage protein
VVNPTAGRRKRAGDPVTMRQVAKARGMQRAKVPLAQIAAALGVRSSDLDRALWQYVDTDVEELVAPVRRPAPMF